MKRLIIVALFLVILSMGVYAKGSYDVDFSELRTHPVFLYEGDEVRFELLGGEHTVIIEDVGSTSVKLDIVVFIGEDTEVWPGLLGFDTVNKVDLDKDGVADLNIALYGIEEDEQVHMVLQDATEGIEDVTGDAGVVDKVVEEGFDWRGTGLKIIGVLIVVVVLFMVFRKKKPESKEEEPERVVIPDEVGEDKEESEEKKGESNDEDDSSDDKKNSDEEKEDSDEGNSTDEEKDEEPSNDESFNEDVSEEKESD